MALLDRRAPCRRLLPVALACVALAACSRGPVRPEAGPEALPPPAPLAAPADETRRRIVSTALQMVGVPYRYGGESPEGFDCSGLVQYAYRSAGISVPRTARDQLDASAPVALADAREGDLLFFRSKDFSHVGIYLGQGRFVHAPSTGSTVSIANFGDAYYRRNFLRAGHIPAMETVSAACAEGATQTC